MSSEGFQLARAFIKVEADTSSVGSDVKRGFGKAEGEAGSSGKRAGGKFAAALKSPLGQISEAIGAVFVVDKAKDFLKDIYGEAEQANSIQRQTAAVLKATGGAAGVSSDQIKELTESLADSTGQTDEAVQSTENLLLSFTNIRNKGPNKIFDETSKAVQDLGVGMKIGPTAAAKVLGKALNDPIKGMSGLSRVGVKLSDDQQDLVKHYVKTGQTAKAQGVILEQVNRKFGGAAAAATTPMERLHTVWDRFKVQLGQDIVPIVDKVVKLFSGKLVPALSLLGDWIKLHVVPLFKELADWIDKHVVPVFVQFGAWFMQHLPQIKSIFEQFAKTMKIEFTAIMSLVMVLYNQALKPLVAWVQAHWPQISTVIKTAFRIAGVEIKVFAAVIRWLLTDIIIPVIKGIIAVISGLITAIVALVKAGIATWHALGTAFSAVSTAIKTTIHALSTAIHAYMSAIRTSIGFIGSAFSSAYHSVTGFIGNIVGAVEGLPGKLGALASKFGSAGKSLMGSFWNGLKNVAGDVGGVASNLWNAIKGFLNRDFIDKIRGIGFSKWGVSFHPFSGIPHFATGGPVSGPGSGTSDSIAAMLSNGEYVVNARSAAKYSGLLDTINGGKGGASRSGGYASGGSVGGNASAIASLLASMGVTKAGIAGFLGNTKIESNFSTTAIGGPAHGLQQWQDGRFAALQRLASKMGESWKSLPVQLAMIKKELSGSYKGTLNNLRNATSARAAAAYVDQHYEISSGQARGQRESAAASIYGKLRNLKDLASVSLSGAASSRETAAQAAAKARAKLLVKVEGSDSLKVLTNLFGNVKALGAATKQLLTDVHTAVAGDKGGDSLVKRLASDTKQLMSVANQRAAVQARLTKLNADLANQRAAFAQTVAGVHDAITGTFDIASAGSDGTVGSMDRLLASLKGNISDAKSFAAELARLRQLGLNKDLLSQLATAGPGSANATALASASAAQVRQINSLSGQLGALGTQAGTTVGADLYGGRIATDMKAVSANSTHLAHLNDSITSLGKRIDKLTHQGELAVKHKGDTYTVDKVVIDASSIKTLEQAENFFTHLKTTARAGRK